MYKLELDVQEPYLGFIKSGKKTVEGRLAKEKYLKLESSDLIRINNLEIKVLNVNRYKSFSEMLVMEGVKNVIPNKDNLDDAQNVYYNFYTREDEKKYGVVGISILVIRELE